MLPERRANHILNGRNALGLVVIWDFPCNTRRTSHSSFNCKKASSLHKFTVFSTKNFETLSGLGCFATLWPNNSKLKPTVTEDYSSTKVPSGLDAPWFLQDNQDDNNTSTASLHDATVNATDPEDTDYSTTGHVYNELLTAPPALDPVLGKPFTTPPDLTGNEGGKGK
jgi:hypothetical protein